MIIKINKTGGVTSTIKRMLRFNNTDPEFIITKEHIDWINKDIGILWSLPNERGVAENVKAQAFKAIPEILSDESCSEKTRENYIEMAKKNLKNGEQVYNNLCFIKALLVNAGGYSEVKKIVKEYHITDLLLTAAESYLTKVTKLFKDLYDYNNIKYVEKYLAKKDPDLLGGRTH